MKTLRRSRRLPRLVGPAILTLGLAGATQVAAGTLSSYAVHTVLVLAGQSS